MSCTARRVDVSTQVVVGCLGPPVYRVVVKYRTDAIIHVCYSYGIKLAAITGRGAIQNLVSDGRVGQVAARPETMVLRFLSTFWGRST